MFFFFRAKYLLYLLPCYAIMVANICNFPIYQAIIQKKKKKKKYDVVLSIND